jgi:hypothetical protein
VLHISDTVPGKPEGEHDMISSRAPIYRRITRLMNRQQKAESKPNINAKRVLRIMQTVHSVALPLWPATVLP